MLTEFVFAFARIIASRVADGANAVLVNLRGFEASEDDPGAETSSDEPLYGTIGLVVRPDPPDETGCAEVLCARLGDQLHPIAGRDLRLNKRVNPKEGENTLPHTGGGFVSLKHNGDGKGTSVTVFAPQLDAVRGAVLKAHVLSMDTTEANKSVTLAHLDGMAVIMNQERHIILKNHDGSQFIDMGPAETVFAGVLKFVGGAVVGSVASAEPVMLSTQLLVWIGQVNATIATLAAAAGNPIPALTPPIAVPVAATTLKASPT